LLQELNANVATSTVVIIVFNFVIFFVLLIS
jgi:hypothetical protein